MLLLISVASLVSGGLLASTAHRHPRLAARFETCGGALLFLGLILLAVSLPTR